MIDPRELHKKFIQLARERNRITYKLLALLPKIHKEKIYEKKGYTNIYDYAAKIAGLSSGVVEKALKLEEKLQDMPHLREKIATQGINKVGIVVGLATKENEKELAEKVENLSKPALQEYSKEVRGKVTAGWRVELDEEMMFMFLKLKKKLGENLSNKECLRKILKGLQEGAGLVKISAENAKAQKQAQESAKIPEEKPKLQKQAQKPGKILGEKSKSQKQVQKQVQGQTKIPGEKSTRYISVYQKQELSERCSHPGCHRPAEIIHHTDRFSQCRNHKNLESLCRVHHEFAHNGISEPMRYADHQYRKYRQAALL